MKSKMSAVVALMVDTNRFHPHMCSDMKRKKSNINMYVSLIKKKKKLLLHSVVKKITWLKSLSKTSKLIVGK